MDVWTWVDGKGSIEDVLETTNQMGRVILIYILPTTNENWQVLLDGKVHSEEFIRKMYNFDHVWLIGYLKEGSLA